MTYHGTPNPTETCPFCGGTCVADTVSVGMGGHAQVDGFNCLECGATESAAHYEPNEDWSPLENRLHWSGPEDPEDISLARFRAHAFVAFCGIWGAKVETTDCETDCYWVQYLDYDGKLFSRANFQENMAIIEGNTPATADAWFALNAALREYPDTFYEQRREQADG